MVSLDENYRDGWHFLFLRPKTDDCSIRCSAAGYQNARLLYFHAFFELKCSGHGLGRFAEPLRGSDYVIFITLEDELLNSCFARQSRLNDHERPVAFVAFKPLLLKKSIDPLRCT